MQISYNELLAHARQEHFAVPAFNYSDLWDMYAIVKTAQEERSPVILATIPAMANLFPMPFCAYLPQMFEQHVDIPVLCHLDHAHTTTLCRQAADLGYDSVMIDGSPYALEENIRLSAEVVKYAHSKGVSVEGEIGHIKGSNIEISYEGEDYLAAVEDAVALVNATGLDTLAVGLGTSHGHYTQRPHIDFDRLREIYDALPVPLVLHGGSGLPDDMVSEAVEKGISKINVGTDIVMTLAGGIGRVLEQNPGKVSLLTAPAKPMEEVQEVARRWIRLCKSNGRV